MVIDPYFRRKPIWGRQCRGWVCPIARVSHITLDESFEPISWGKVHWLLPLLWWNNIKGETSVLLLFWIQFLQITSVLCNLRWVKLLRRPCGHPCTPEVEQSWIPRGTATKYTPRQLLDAQLLQPEHSHWTAIKMTPNEAERTLVPDSELHP